MMRKIRILLGLFILVNCQMVRAGQDEASAALVEILFDSDMENISYAVDGRGNVDIVFGISVPDDRFVDVVGKIRAHPDIPSVLSSRSLSDFCRKEVN